MSTAEKTILHIDDDADDRELLRDFMLKVAPELKIDSAENGLEALEMLNETKRTKSLPCLIVLDLNMPYLNGKETFESIRADPQLKDIPLVILSSSHNPSEKSRFTDQGVAYFTKPIVGSDMEKIANHMANFCA